jgi:hypothetical protein
MKEKKTFWLGYNLKILNSIKIIDTYEIYNSIDDAFSFNNIFKFEYTFQIEVDYVKNHIIIAFDRGFKNIKDFVKDYQKKKADFLLLLTNCPFFYFLSNNSKKRTECNEYSNFNLNFIINFDDLYELKDFLMRCRKNNFLIDRNLSLHENFEDNKNRNFIVFSKLLKLIRKIIFNFKNNRLYNK